MEPKPGERFEVDWGHFGSLDYQGDQRKLYAFALVDGHSRMLYLEFTHSQSFETFVRCHVHAFQTLNGVAREICYDNLATAVAEHDGRLVRFHPRFLGLCPRVQLLPARLQSGERLGKRKSGTRRHRYTSVRTSGRCASSLDLHDVNRQARAVARSESPIGDCTAKPASAPSIASNPMPSARCRSSLMIIATPSRRWSTKISDCSSMAIATACRIAMSAAVSR